MPFDPTTFNTAALPRHDIKDVRKHPDWHPDAAPGSQHESDNIALIFRAMGPVAGLAHKDNGDMEIFFSLGREGKNYSFLLTAREKTTINTSQDPYLATSNMTAKRWNDSQWAAALELSKALDIARASTPPKFLSD